ncbi:unnamed protein product [Eruca vesicaria subsp. sativa]|uniref:Uncharacterized protein n=1 Tax=Eruca vesicaria subsp. sativa TaxID=29727 RepID=A0ABC8M6S1_ERUVS|nr:unnamed protein product [Eruca vesicaria subsp. sativa]
MFKKYAMDLKPRSLTYYSIFVETSALEALNVEDAFTQLLSQIYRVRVASKKALDVGDDDSATL